VPLSGSALPALAHELIEKTELDYDTIDALFTRLGRTRDATALPTAETIDLPPQPPTPPVQ
jgi:hypothetical protein